MLLAVYSDRPFLYAFLVLVIAGGLAIFLMMDPGLRRERRKPGPGGADRWLRFTIQPFLLALLVVAGVDTGGFRRSHLPAAVQIVPLVVLAAGYALALWAIRHNRF